jgi:prolipoprotein diacylglyceryl transferase
VPAPPFESLDIAGLEVRLYPLCVFVGFLVFMLLTARIWERGGGDAVDAMWACLLAAPMALVGARLYSAATDALRGSPSPAFDFSQGGLGIYGAILAGMAALVVIARSRQWPVGTFLDCAVPGLALGQAIGRLGNWFNQELYGSPTSLPWGLAVDEPYRPLGMLDEPTFHPAFLYEAMWDVTVCGLLLLLWPRLWERFRPGAVAATYVALYGAGRLAIEVVRIDETPTLAGIRLNQVVSLFATASALLALAMLDRRRRPR